MIGFEKIPVPTTPEKLTDWEMSLINENFVNQPSDLAKLLMVLKSGLNAEDWPQDEAEMRDLVVKKVINWFDGSGETATENSFEMAVEYGFIRIETDPKTQLKR